MTVGLPSWMVPPAPKDEPAEKVTVTIVDRRLVASDIVEFTLGVDDRRLPEWEPGAHVDIHLPDGKIRQYSLCGNPSDRHQYRVAVLREPEGRGGSVYLHDRVAIGDQVDISLPRNHFRLVDAKSYLFIAGGIGITPVLPMIHSVDAAGGQWSLAYCGRTSTSMAYWEDLEADHRARVWTSSDGERLDVQALLAEQQAGTVVYCCGPERLMTAVEDSMQACPQLEVHLERFKPVDVDLPSMPFAVELARTGIQLEVPSERSLIDVLEHAGIVVPASCRQGTCGTCETTVLQGDPEHRDTVLTPAERSVGDCMMVCVSRSGGAPLVLDL